MPTRKPTTLTENPSHNAPTGPTTNGKMLTVGFRHWCVQAFEMTSVAKETKASSERILGKKLTNTQASRPNPSAG
jgi:hypothetical protein